jgi:hypothetical protein
MRARRFADRVNATSSLRRDGHLRQRQIDFVARSNQNGGTALMSVKARALRDANVTLEMRLRVAAAAIFGSAGAILESQLSQIRRSFDNHRQRESGPGPVRK